MATLHNDGLLILDELSQIDPKVAGEAAYLLANGQGKMRASKNGTAKQAARWKLLFLSAGEESLSGLMGIFETLHEQPTPEAMALALKEHCNQFYGAVGMAWIRLVVIIQSIIQKYHNK